MGAGFYKTDSGELLHAEVAVYGPGWSLTDEGDSADGWAFFINEQAARQAFGLPQSEEQG
jgi:hypothetical protein